MRLKRKKWGTFFSKKTLILSSLGITLGFVLVIVYLISAKNASAAWYHDSWGFRRKLTIDNTKVSGSSNLTNFPVLVSFTSDTNLSANAKADGSDILFVDAKGVPLVHEIEYYSSGTLVAWVQIPTLATSTDTAIYMYYGNSTASGLENESAVWASDYRGVWHLAETSGQHLDSTTNNNDSTTVNVTTQGSATGKVGGASDFASGNEVIMADSASLDISGSFTAQAWVKADTIGGSGTWNSIIYKSGNSNYFLELTNTDEIDAGFYGGGDWRSVTTSTSPVSTGTFYHLAVVHDAAADTIKVYVNGVEKGSASSITQTPLVNTGTFTIGENFYNETFDGIIDEVRLSATPKTVDWLLTEYNNQNSPSTFYSKGFQEERKKGPGAYWKFDEGYGTSVNDASGNENSGTLGSGTPAPTWKTKDECIFEGCLDFDGTNDYVSVSDNSAIDLGNEGTIQAWVRSDDTSSSISNFAAWTSQTAPNGTAASDFSDADMVIVGDKAYFAAYMHAGATETFQTASVNLDGTGFSAWTTQTAPDGSAGNETTSVAIDSDGVKLYYAAFTHSGPTESFYTAYSDLDGTNFSSWTTQTPPSGAGNVDGMYIDMVLVNSKMYFATYLHEDAVETFQTASANLDGTSFSGWTSQTAPDGAADNNPTAVGVASDGQKLYYAAYTNNASDVESFYTSYSNLDGTGFQSWTSQTAPTGGSNQDMSTIDIVLVGNMLYYAAYLHDGLTEAYQTASSTLTGGSFSGWTSRTAADGAGAGESSVTALGTDGKKLYYMAFSHDGATESFYTTSSDVASHPIISKPGAYELIQTGGGFVLDWAGSPKSFGDISASTWNHVAITQDGTTMKYFVNARLLRTQTVTTDFTSNANNLLVGGDGTRFFNGKIDEVKVYPYARTEDEIKQDYLFSSAKGASAVLGAQDNAFLSNGLVGYWKMDETTGTTGPSWTAIDSSGNSNSGTGGGNVSQATGKFGNAAQFDGLVDYIEANNATSVFDPSSGSMCAWTNATSDSDEATVVSFTSSIGGNQGVFIKNDFGSWVMGYDNSTNHIVSSNFNFSLNNWTHLCFVWDGDTILGYQNGELKDSITIDGEISATIDYFNIGTLQNDFSYIADFSGKIDEVRVYKRVLNRSEISAIYQWEPGPVSYWNLDENSGTVANDRGTNDNSGTLTNNPTWISGKYGQAINTNSASAYVNIGDPADGSLDFDADDDFTISSWIRTSDQSATSRTWIYKGFGGGDPGYRVRLATDGDPTCGIADSAAETSEVTFNNNPLNDGQWHNVTCVLSGGGTQLSIYVDGRYGGVIADAEGSLVSAISLTIGNNHATAFWPGDIDDVKIYRYARTQEQILMDINAGHPAVGTPVGSTILHTKFNEGYGTTVNDSSSLGNNGTLGTGTSSPSWSNDGKFGKALSFDGNDYVDFGDNDELKLTFPFTISAWVNIDELPADEYTIVSKWYSFTSDREYAFQIVGDNRLRFGFSSTGINSELVYADTAFSAADFGQWVHVVLTADESRNYTFYRNGKPDGSGTFTLTSIANDTASAMIGAVHYSNSLPSRFFKGKIDEVKLYPFDLNSEQVKTEFNGGKTMVLGAKSTGVGGTAPSNSAGREYCVPGDASTCGAPIAEWNMDDGVSGDNKTIADTSGNNNSGTTKSANGTGMDCTAPGKLGKGCVLDGTDDYIQVVDPGTGSILDFSSGEAISIEMWIKPRALPSSGTYQTFLTKGGIQDGQLNYLLEVGNVGGNGIIGFCYSTAALAYQCYEPSDNILEIGKWQHVAMTYTFATGNSMKLYKNGQMISGSWTSNNGNAAPAETNQDLWIGSDSTPSPFNGSIDAVKIYDYTRTPAQIAWEYDRGGPIAHYKFDECQGTTAYNSSVNGNNEAAGMNGTISIGASGEDTVGNCSTSSTAWGSGATGKINSSLDFDGTDDYVAISDASTISFGDGSTDKPFSITAWIKMDDATDFQFISKMPASGVLSNLEWALGVGATDRLGIRLYDNSALVYIGKYSDATLTAYENQWIHVTMTYDGSESGNGISLYINGKIVPGTAESAGTYAGIENTASDLFIGGLLPSDATYKKFANGKIDDVRIYNYELSTAQVKSVMTNGSVSFK